MKTQSEQISNELDQLAIPFPAKSSGISAEFTEACLQARRQEKEQELMQEQQMIQQRQQIAQQQVQAEGQKMN